MKKVFVLFISFFLIISNVDALSTVSRMNVDVKIDENGIASIEETWYIPKQSDYKFQKVFYKIGEAEINDLYITDVENHEYFENNKMKNELYNYNLKTSGKNKYLNINTNGLETTLIIKYNVVGMISSYDDIDGIRWYFLNTLSNMEVFSFNVTIENFNEINESNTGIYGIGNNIDCKIEDNKIIIHATDLGKHNKVLLFTTFTDIRYPNNIKINDNFNHYFKHHIPSLTNDIINFIVSESLIIIIIILIIVSVIIITKLVLTRKRVDAFKKIKIKNKNKFVLSIDSAKYYDIVPCNNDIYHLEFIISLFKITKNRSNIVSAIILKWLINNQAIMDIENNAIILKENQTFDNNLDQELYNILMTACNGGIIKKVKLDNYLKDKKEELENWYSHIYAYGLECEKKLGHAKIKKHKVIIQSAIVDEANNILGLKKYLLNFNQVPRSSKLTSSLYEELVISSTLLGVSKSYAKEILRKNNENNLAKILQDYEKVVDNVKYFYVPIKSHKKIMGHFIVHKKKKTSSN